MAPAGAGGLWGCFFLALSSESVRDSLRLELLFFGGLESFSVSSCLTVGSLGTLAASRGTLDVASVLTGLEYLEESSLLSLRVG